MLERELIDDMAKRWIENGGDKDGFWMCAAKIAAAIDWIIDEPNRLQEEAELIERIDEERKIDVENERLRVLEEEWIKQHEYESGSTQIGNLPWNQ